MTDVKLILLISVTCTYIFIVFQAVCYIFFISVYPYRLVINNYNSFDKFTIMALGALPVNIWFIVKIVIVQFMVKKSFIFAIFLTIINVVLTVLYVLSFQIFKAESKRLVKYRCFLPPKDLYFVLTLTNFTIVLWSLFTMLKNIATRLNLLKQKSKKRWIRARPPIRLSRVLLKNPHKKIIVKKIRIATPRKPNSARRKIVKGRTSLLQTVLTYIPGGEHTLKNFSQITISGRGPRDIPGIYSRGIRGKSDLLPVAERTKRRSLFGIKKLSC